MEQSHAAIGTAVARWWRRENLLPGLALLALTAIAWGYTLSQARSMNRMAMPAAPANMSAPPASTAMGNMDSMDMPTMSDGTMAAAESPAAIVRPGDLILFLVGWAVMMVAMMLPAALPLILLYRIIARKRLQTSAATAGMVALLAGYVGVWTLAGLPVYAYTLVSASQGPAIAVLPGLLLVAGGIYQFTALKHGCHARCSNPLFFLMNRWRPGVTGAARLGLLHGVDCLGCCVGLMLALVALGMMNVAWMLTAAVIIFAEKTLPSGHRIARPLGVALVIGGVVIVGRALLNGAPAM